MRKDLAKMVKTIISLSTEYESDYVLLGLEELKEKWPNVTAEEQLEMDAIISAYKAVAIDEDEEEENLEIPERRYSFDEEPKGFFRKLFR